MQNAESQEDLRVRRTRKMLQEALIELTVEKKGFGAITVSDLTERAMVNRSTFYRHYMDKCDLVDQYMNEVYELTALEGKVAVPHAAAKGLGEVPIGLLNLLKHVQDNAEFYRIMLGVDGDPGFTEHFRQNTARPFRGKVDRQQPMNDKRKIPFEMRIRYVAHAGVGAIRWWLENDQPCSVEQLARWISQLSYPIWSGSA